MNTRAKGPAQEAVLVQATRLLKRIGLLICLPLALLSLIIILLMEFFKSPGKFFSRSQHKVQLPSSLDGIFQEHLDIGGGIRIHAVSFGRQPNKPLMLFLHGFPECWYSWRDLLVHLRTEYEVVSVDMRGFNTSSKPKGISSYTLDHLTADVAGVVQALGRSSCTLVGHDWGGVVAWAVAGRYPGLVDRLMVLSGPQWWLYERNLTPEQMARSFYFLWSLLPFLPELLLTHTDCVLVDSIWRGGFVYSVRRCGAVSAEDVEIYKAALQQPGAATATLNYYRALMLTALGVFPLHPEVEAAVLRRLEMPVLVVWGADDCALRLSTLRDLHLVAAHAEVHVLPNCSHWVQFDQPQELRRVMDEWLAENPITQRAPPPTKTSPAD